MITLFENYPPSRFVLLCFAELLVIVLGTDKELNVIYSDPQQPDTDIRCIAYRTC